MAATADDKAQGPSKGLFRRKPAAKEPAKAVNIDDMWVEAMEQIAKDYNVSSKDLQKWDGELEEGETGIERAQALFQDLRHPEDKKDHVRQTVGRCLDWVETGVGFVTSHVSGTYAVPAQVLSGAISYMIKGARDMSADFDQIESTFKTLDNSLTEIRDLEQFNFKSDSHTFLERLTAIFVAMVRLCALSGRVFSLSRKERYVRVLIKGRDQRIQEACDQVTGAIDLFRKIVPMETLGQVQLISTAMKNLPDELIEKVQAMKLSDLQPLWGKPSNQMEMIKEAFKRANIFHPEIEIRMGAYLTLVEKQQVEGTFSWTEDESADYKAWESGRKAPYLFVVGDPGAGKTFFACHCYRSIKERRVKSSGPLVIYFPFQIGMEESQTLGSVLAYIIFQVGIQDRKLLESIAKDMTNSKEFDKGRSFDDEKRIKFIWQNLLKKKFEKIPDSSRELFIILDGIELMDQSQRKTMLDLFQELSSERYGIRILMTGTDSVSMNLKGLGLPGCPKIVLDDKIKKGEDIRKIMWSRINKSSRLQSYSKTIWERVEQKLLDSPNPLSTVDITMTVMEQASDEKSGLETIKKLTKQDGLYEVTIRSLLNGKSNKDCELFQFIFSHCCLSQRPLSIYVLREFLNQEPIFQGSELDIAQQIQTHLSSFLYVTNYSDNNPAPGVENEAPLPPLDKEEKIALSKRQTVVFRQITFREYLEKNPNNLIPDPLKSKVSFFVKLTNILCGKDAEGAGLRESLQEYATQQYMEHLKDIDVKQAAPLEGVQVVEALTRVYSNDGTVSRVFEDKLSQSYEDEINAPDVYNISLEPDSKGAENLKVLKEWAKKMNFHDEQDLSSQAREWIEITIHGSEKMLEKLAQDHFQRWAETKDYRNAKVPYTFLYCALRLRREKNLESQNSGDDKASLIKAVLEYGEKGNFIRTPIQLARCRISAALVLLNESIEEEAREIARKLYTENIEQKETPGPERFYSHIGLAEFFYGEGENDLEVSGVNGPEERWKLVLLHAEKALHSWWKEKSALGSDLSEERCIKAFLLKGNALKRLERDDEAISTCHRCFEENFPYDSQTLDLVLLMVDIHAKNNQWAQLIDAMWQRDPKTQSEFLNFIFLETHDATQINRIMKAAVESRRVEYLIRMIEEAIDYWQDEGEGPEVIFQQLALAEVYQSLLRAPRMAVHVMTENIPEDGFYKDFHFLIFFPGLVDIHHEYFQLAYSEKVKLESVAKLDTLIQSYDTNPYKENCDLAMAELTLAKMFFKLGKVSQAETHVSRAFDLCIFDLEDSIASNDRGALCTLGKVLAFMGLEMEAKVAFSLAFSRLGASDDDNSSSSESDLQSSDHAASDCAALEYDKSDPDKVKGISDAGDVHTETGDIQPIERDTDLPYQDSNNTVLGNESNVIEIKTNGGLENRTSAVSEAPLKSLETNSSTNGILAKGQSNKQTGAEPDQQEGRTEMETEVKAEAEEEEEKEEEKAEEQPSSSFDQDLTSFDNPLLCSGDCDPSVSWTSYEAKGPKTWYCLECMSMEFCMTCYTKQINFFDKREDGFWFKCCWSRHEYIEAPIDGWLGVKNGWIHMEHRVDDQVEVQKIQWEDWLRSVKGRWAKRINSSTVWDDVEARLRSRRLARPNA